jgi:hypothetical protein
MSRLFTLLPAAALALGLTVATPATSHAQVAVGVNVGPVGVAYQQGYAYRPGYVSGYGGYFRPYHHLYRSFGAYPPRPVVVVPPTPTVIVPAAPAPTVVVPARPIYPYPY